MVIRLAGARPPAAHRWKAASYAALMETAVDDLAAGTYVFLDLDRLDDDSAFRLARLWNRLSAREGVRCVNHPTRTRHRFEMLRLLHEQGVNAGDVRRVEDRRAPTRWPVLIRDELAILTAPIKLLSTVAELSAETRRLERDAVYRPPLLMVELPGATAPPGAVGVVLHIAGTLMPSARAQGLLALPGAPAEADLLRLFALGEMAVGQMVLALVGGRVTVIDVGADLAVPSDPATLAQVADGLLAL